MLDVFLHVCMIIVSVNMCMGEWVDMCMQRCRRGPEMCLYLFCFAMVVASERGAASQYEINSARRQDEPREPVHGVCRDEQSF